MYFANRSTLRNNFDDAADVCNAMAREIDAGLRRLRDAWRRADGDYTRLTQRVGAKPEEDDVAALERIRKRLVSISYIEVGKAQ